jgi:hypothetical protein
MSDLRDAIRGAADRNRPPEDWLDRIRERARKKRRNQRVLAGIVGFGLTLVVLVALVAQLRERQALKPADRWNVPAQCGSGTKVSPTGWWRADGLATDAAGGHAAVLHGGATFAPGIVGGAYALDGKDDWVEVPYDPALDVGSQDFTVAFWVMFTSTPGNRQVLMEDWIETFDSTTSKGWTLVNPNDRSLSLTTGAAGAVTAHQVDLPVGTWIHVAIRRSAGTLSIFVNGSLAAAQSIADDPLPLDSNTSLKFGHRGTTSDTPGSLDHRGFFLHGELDEIELFVGRALSGAQIRHIFKTQSSCAL